ncbi:MAG: AmmeMemoRadiSam system protein A [Desulfobulbaceae bacterium]|jgi:AmmeMemoRadiSam system protein A|nr:AmmeMemoRadiSam system protein A [Desulfobulbaceae bacterium]
MKLTAAEKKTLLTLARQTIGGHFTGAESPTPDAPALMRPAATFVTLKKNGELRGCIGNLTATETLAESVRHNALAAACNDSRFAPLSAAELPAVSIEISLLSEAQPLDYADANELRRRLRPGIDGVILSSGRRGATFLPQVWEQLPTAELFLSHLCRKAGLPADFWRTGQPEIAVYQVAHFAEEAGAAANP